MTGIGTRGRCLALCLGASLLGLASAQPSEPIAAPGLPEALSPQDQPCGEQRLTAALAQISHSPQALLARVQAELAEHMGQRSPHVDVTLLCISAAASLPACPEG